MLDGIFRILCGEWSEVRDFLKQRKRINEQIVAMATIAYAGTKLATRSQSSAASLAFVFFLAIKRKRTANASMMPIIMLAMTTLYPRALLPSILMIAIDEFQLLQVGMLKISQANKVQNLNSLKNCQLPF